MNTKPRFSKATKKQTLADQVAETIREAIITADWQGGEALPTEPELAEQFGVSRAVVRDATRMLAAQGLVEVRHGKGVFVTGSQTEAFGDALLLALRRNGASAWDVEQFEQMVFPEVCALVASQASAEELVDIRDRIQRSMETFATINRRYWNSGETPPPDEHSQMVNAHRDAVKAMFDATHNRVWQLLAEPLLNLREMRHWEAGDLTVDEAIEMESSYWQAVLAAIETRDPKQARERVARLMQLPPEAVEAMQQTPVAELVRIPIPLPRIRPGF
ncbi:MAG: FadR family transcriptional regulator [Chloroflexi bacterium]|nr:FadR family transcriptional regulator [Chloroflexota bacterium]